MSKSADAFRTISEVADWLGIPAHVLRFWESKFTQVKPVKRAGGRRYYRPADMQLLGGIRKLLHDEGMTIKGVQKILREQGVKHVLALSPPMDMDDGPHLDDITLAVAPETPEERGQVLSFERSTAPGPAKEGSPEPEEAPEEEASEAASRKHERAPPTQDEADPAPEQPRVPDPKPDVAPPAKNAAIEAAPDNVDETPETPPLPRPRQVTTPADPPDDIAAPGAALSALAGIRPPVTLIDANALSNIAARLRDLRSAAGKGNAR